MRGSPLRGPEDQANGFGHPLPAGDFLLELAAALRGQAVDLRLPSRLRLRPGGGEPRARQQAQGAEELGSAQDELEGYEAVAEEAFEEAQAAADAVSAKLAENESLNSTMLRQLANLRNTAEELERQRREGLAAEARQNAIKDAPTAPELYTVGAPNSGKVETAIAFAKEQLGERYVLGGAGPDIWDCSGITMKSYSAAGVYIGWHSATAQFNVLASQKKLVPFQDAQRGDLIWWTRSSSFSGDKYHVAIYLGDGMMLEAPNPARTVRIVPVRYGELFPYAGRPSA